MGSVIWYTHTEDEGQPRRSEKGSRGFLLGGFAVAVITAGFALLGVYISNRKQAALVAYRLEKLEEKVDKHNNVVERMYKLESRVEALERQKM